MPDEKSTEQFDGPEALRAWLHEHHASSPGIWLRIAKKGSGVSTPSYDEALDVALSYGWIDAQRKKLDDDFFVQAFGPRRPRGAWSKRNREKVEALIAAGLMRPSGQAEVDRAKADGRWDRAYDRPSEAEQPADFLERLEQDPAAKAFYETINSQSRFAIYYRIHEAKRPETRARRIEKFVEMLGRGETIY